MVVFLLSMSSRIPVGELLMVKVCMVIEVQFLRWNPPFSTVVFCCAPCIVRFVLLFMVTFSVYMPENTKMLSPLDALSTASCIVV